MQGIVIAPQALEVLILKAVNKRSVVIGDIVQLLNRIVLDLSLEQSPYLLRTVGRHHLLEYRLVPLFLMGLPIETDIAADNDKQRHETEEYHGYKTSVMHYQCHHETYRKGNHGCQQPAAHHGHHAGHPADSALAIPGTVHQGSTHSHSECNECCREGQLE